MSPLKRIAITGSSGYYGRALIRALRSCLPEIEIQGFDIAEPAEDIPDEFVRCDIRSDQLEAHLERFRPDTVVHFAFIVNPIHDKEHMRQVNVEGTRHVLEVVGRIAPQRLLVSSSATVYGAWPENPVPISEGHPLRARREFQYAEDKVFVEEMLESFSQAHPEIDVSWTRPAIMYGQGVENYLVDFISRVVFVVLLDGEDAPVQFVHLDDVAAATLEILQSGCRGPFNIAPPDWITLRQLAKIKHRVCLKIPFSVCRWMSDFWWTCRLPWFRFPSGLLYFMRYPWVVAPTRLTEELNFTFRHTTTETIRQMLVDTGWLKAEPKASEASAPSAEPVSGQTSLEQETPIV